VQASKSSLQVTEVLQTLIKNIRDSFQEMPEPARAEISRMVVKSRNAFVSLARGLLVSSSKLRFSKIEYKAQHP
jgi:hypothetical protein